MTHFNHDWDTTKAPAVPVSVGDRYYAQDLNDDFNYLKHLPYEVFLQGKSRGIMVSPNDTWNNDTDSLTLSGGFGVILQDCIELDPSEDFVIPPKTHSSPRYERIPFADTTLVIPTDNTTRYIVATPTKRSLLQRAKTLFTEQYASRVRYDGVITIQDTAPTAGQILVGLCCNKEYCLLIDNNPNQCKDNIILKKWFGQAKITQDFVPALQSYYNTSIASTETDITINTVSASSNGIQSGVFNNCTIAIDTISSGSYGISGGTFNNCTITITTVSDGGYGISGGTCNDCTITINTVNSGGYGISGGTCNDCAITITTVNRSGYGNYNGTFNNCTITINTVNNGGRGVTSSNCNDCIITIAGGMSVYQSNCNNCNITIANSSAYQSNCNNCTITIDTVDGNRGINGGNYSNCTIAINTVNNGIGFYGGKYDNCVVTITTVSGSASSNGIQSGVFNNCTIAIDTISSGICINSGFCRNCTIAINTVNGGYGISSGTCNDCAITITTINGGHGIRNANNVILYLTQIKATSITDLSSTGGKLNILNDTILHAS